MNPQVELSILFNLTNSVFYTILLDISSVYPLPLLFVILGPYASLFPISSYDSSTTCSRPFFVSISNAPSSRTFTVSMKFYVSIKSGSSELETDSS